MDRYSREDDVTNALAVDLSSEIEAEKKNEEFTGNLKRQLAKLLVVCLKLTVPDEPSFEPLVAASAAGKFGDYQCNNAMGLWSIIKGKGTQFKGPPAVGLALVKSLPTSEMVESCSVARPGYINVVLSAKWMAKLIFPLPTLQNKYMLVILRSTIIGDMLARMLEYSKVEVLRRNHVDDWGTKFGMLIEYLFEKFPDTDSVIETDVVFDRCFTRHQKKKFDLDEDFKERAQQAVVRLQAQGGDPVYRKAWAKICEISRTEFAKVYQRLRVELEERYWLDEEKAQWMIYNTAAGQEQHLSTFFKKEGWLPGNEKTYPRVNHVGFGLVLGEDGKRFRTRATDVVRLVDLVDEAKTRSKLALIERGKDKEWTPEELDQTTEAVGYGAVNEFS
ncbi:hypothetical protein ARALYDRAFT_904472 [Arabidopsis lyrata subsp. lyrata]|uniref:arginine--tRNA ligase n=1 Tax=Arabidopsis lyrata subsp. lyrata TaxID=81972 RepID=D7LQ31_ARALL|nr:hypothetical protein ARALYDRAFT_904472 [Arabidopsis lyrata subsp. lyrata]